MDFPKSVPSVGLVDGKFIDEDAVTGTTGSLIPSAWGNAVTQEILNVIEAAGLEPDEENTAQLLAAIDAMVGGAVVYASQAEAEAGEEPAKVMSPLRVFQAIAKVVKQATETAFGWLKIANQNLTNAGVDDQTAVTPKKLSYAIQLQTFTAVPLGGAAPNFTLTPVPAIAAYATNQRFRVKFSGASTGADTINVSGKGAKNLKQYNSIGEKVSAVFVSGQLSDVEYDGVDMVMLNPLPAINQATEVLVGGASVATQALTNAGVNDATFITPKKLFAWVAAGISTATETLFGFAKLATQGVVDSGVDDATIVTPKKLRGGASWLLATNGYLALPSWLGGIIINWGRVTVVYDTGTTVNFSMNYASSIFAAFASVNTSTTTPNGNYSAYANAISNSQITLSNDGNVSTGATSQLISWLTIGK